MSARKAAAPLTSDFHFGPRRLLRADAYRKAVRADRELGRCDIAVLRAMIDRVDDQGWAIVDVASIAREARYSVRSVRYATKRLFGSGKIDTVRRWVAARQNLNEANAYRLYPNVAFLPAPLSARPTVPPTGGKVLRYARPTGKTGRREARSALEKTLQDQAFAEPGRGARTAPKDRRKDPICISGSDHPYSNLEPIPKRPVAPLPRVTSEPAPPAPPLDAVDAVLVALAARLFPTCAQVAHRGVARLKALGWTTQQIAVYLGKAAKEPKSNGVRVVHPLYLVVTAAERGFAPPPNLTEPPRPSAPTPLVQEARRPPWLERHEREREKVLERRRSQERTGDGDGSGGGGGRPDHDERIATARAALARAEQKTGLKRRLTASDFESGGEGQGGKKDDEKP